MAAPLIQIASSAEQRAACIALRHEVFVSEQGVSVADEVDGLDEECTHVLALLASVPVGAARFRIVKDAVKIQRVCVSRSARGSGIGAAIIEFIVEEAKSRKLATYARLGAQTHALDFYRKLGFEPYGDEYIDAGILHRDMQLKL